MEGGEDLTENAKQVKGIPHSLFLHTKGRMEVRGEVYLSKRALEALNQKVPKPFANCRNAAAGTMRQLDPTVVAERGLEFIAYEVIRERPQKIHSYSLMGLEEEGFNLTVHGPGTRDISEIATSWDTYIRIRDQLPYDIDGFVVKIDSYALRTKVGVVSNAPKWAIAVKLPAMEVTTTLNGIDVQIGRTGVLTPVARLEPVACGGVVVSNATLFNFNRIKELDLRIGDRVWIKRAGDVIPQVIKVVERDQSATTEVYAPPKDCPVCGSPVIATSDVVMKCSNTHGNCNPQLVNAITHLASRGAFNIDGIGEQIAMSMVDSGLVTFPLAVFMLDKETLAKAAGTGELTTNHLWAEINKARRMELGRFLFGLGIPTVGESTAKAIASHFGNIRSVLCATYDELLSLPDIGPITANSVVRYFQAGGKDQVDTFLKLGGGEIIPTQKRSTYRFAITGSFSELGRHEIKHAVESLGHQTTDTVNASTTAVKQKLQVFTDLTAFLDYVKAL